MYQVKHNRHLLLWASLIVGFISFHLPHLHLPHFWDEAWVYAPAIKTMAKGVPSPLPGAISLELGRGHPLLFQFLGGVWVKVFGGSNTSAHLFAIAISVSLLAFLVFSLQKTFDSQVAISAILFVAVQPIFLVQSAMVYPEMLLALGFFIALLGYVQKSSGLFVVGLCVALYAKESALVFFIAFVAWDILRFILKDITLASFKKYIIPLLVLLSHPLLLFAEYGWFLYPEHTGLITWDVQSIKYNLRFVFRLLFEDQNRNYLVYPILALAALSVRLKHWSLNLILIGVAFSAYKILVWKWVVPSWLYIVLLLLFLAVPLVFWLFLSPKSMNRSRHFLGVGYITIVGFLVFSAMNFFSPRYILVLVILLMTMLAIVLWQIRFLPTWSKWLLSFLAVLVSLHSLVTDRNPGEIDLGLYDDLRAQQSMVDWVVDNVQTNESVSANFISATYLTDPFAGYVQVPFVSSYPIFDICSSSPKSDYYLFAPTSDGCDVGLLDSLLNHNGSIVFSDTVGHSVVLVIKTEPRNN